MSYRLHEAMKDPSEDGCDKGNDVTARQRSNAAEKKNYVRANSNATLGIKCRSNGSGASPNCRCRLLAVEVDPAVQTSKLMQRKGQMANR